MKGLRTPAGVMVARGEWYEGKYFRSQLEKHRYIELRTLELAGAIADLECQPRYPIYVVGSIGQLANAVGKVLHAPALGCTYVADFRYRQTTDDSIVVEDTKGFKTDEYRLKKRLVEKAYGIEVVEVTSAGGRRRRGRKR